MIIKGIAMKMTGLFLLMTLLVPPTIARADDFARRQQGIVSYFQRFPPILFRKKS